MNAFLKNGKKLMILRKKGKEIYLVNEISQKRKFLIIHDIKK